MLWVYHDAEIRNIPYWKTWKIFFNEKRPWIYKRKLNIKIRIFWQVNFRFNKLKTSKRTFLLMCVLEYLATIFLNLFWTAHEQFRSTKTDRTIKDFISSTEVSIHKYTY